MNSTDRGSLLLRGMGIVVVLFCFLTFRPSAVPLRAEGISFSDDLNAYDTDRWVKADGWCNPPWFDACWHADHIVYGSGLMTIRLDDTPCSGGCSDRSYASGEYRTNDPAGGGDEYYGYGCFEARFRPPAGSGSVTSFFTYSGGTWDTQPGGNGEHNEIDIEILGRDTTRMQANFTANGVGNHEQMISLGFDAAADLHNYAVKWTDAGIEWYVDGSLVHSVADDVSDPTPDAALANGGHHKIMMNLWPVDPDFPDLVDWAGTFSYSEPLLAEYDWVRYTAGSDCVPAGPGPAAPGDLSATVAAHARVNLSWTDNSGNESGFRVERSADGITGWEEIATVGADVTSYADGSAGCNRTVHYRVRAYNANGYSVYSNPDSATTDPCPIYLPFVVSHWPPGPPALVLDFERIDGWLNPYGDLDQFGTCADAVQGDYALCIGGDHEGYTWVGETYKYFPPPQDWTGYDVLRVWMRRVDTPSRSGEPYLSLIILDGAGGKAYLHRDNDLCQNWPGGGWRTPIERDGWALYLFPLRQEDADDCRNTTTIDWASVSGVNVQLRTNSSHAAPSDVYLDWMTVGFGSP